jgi:hypothetical protein
VEAPRALRLTAATAGALPALWLAGCGDAPRQDAGEPAGTYRVSIAAISFPARQRVARQERLVVAVRNTGRRTVPQLAVTVERLAVRTGGAQLADRRRPVWIVDRPPRGSTTATADTWALGRLEPGRTRRFVWRLTPVRAGTHRVSVRIAAGLTGRAKAVVEGGLGPVRELTVRISARPSGARVDPETGAVVRSAG